MPTIFSIDGYEFNVGRSSIQRKAAILDGDNAGRAKSGLMLRDVIGTYYNYGLDLFTRDMNVADYDALYEILTAPVSSHSLLLPYGQSSISFQAYISNADDKLKSATPATNLWGDLKVNFTAMAPQRR